MTVWSHDHIERPAAQNIAFLTNIIGTGAVWVIEERKENYGYLTVRNCGIVIPILVTI